MVPPSAVLVTFWLDSAAAYAAAATTIAWRLHNASWGLADGRFWRDAENHRMVAEKARAATDGCLASAAAWNRLWLKAMFGTMPRGGDLIAAGVAGLGPGHRRARANAKRLARRAVRGRR